VHGQTFAILARQCGCVAVAHVRILELTCHTSVIQTLLINVGLLGRHL
jgi:hypothetical protein